MFGLITARRHRAELAAARAEANRQRARAVKAEKAEATAKFNRGQVLAQNAELHTANARLEGRNKALGDRLLEAQVAAGFNPVAARRRGRADRPSPAGCRRRARRGEGGAEACRPVAEAVRRSGRSDPWTPSGQCALAARLQGRAGQAGVAVTERLHAGIAVLTACFVVAALAIRGALTPVRETGLYADGDVTVETPLAALPCD